MVDGHTHKLECLPTSYDMLGAFQNVSLCPLSMARSLNSQVDEQQLVVGQEEWSIVERRWLSCFCVLINLLTVLANHNLLTIYGEKCISSIGYPYVSLHNTHPYSEAILVGRVSGLEDPHVSQLNHSSTLTLQHQVYF